MGGWEGISRVLDSIETLEAVVFLRLFSVLAACTHIHLRLWFSSTHVNDGGDVLPCSESPSLIAHVFVLNDEGEAAVHEEARLANLEQSHLHVPVVEE